MEFAIEVTPRAEADIQAAYAYIADASSRAATRWVVRLRQAIRSLAEMPGRCPLAPEAVDLDAELRQLLVGRRGGTYRVVFRIVRRGGGQPIVQVLAVRHGARDRLRAGYLDL